MRALRIVASALFVMCFMFACDANPYAAPSYREARGEDPSSPADASSSNDANDPPRVTDASVDGDAAEPPPAPCTPLSGEQEWTINSAGGARRFIVHVPPPSPTGARRSLLFLFHGAGGTAEIARSNGAFDGLADTKNMIVVYPRGYQQTWNGPSCCGPAAQQNIDDVQFVRDMLDTVLTPRYCIDARRVYAAGFSNGAYFTHRLACDLSDRIAAVAAVAGINAVPSCAPKRPLSVLQVHGTGDPVILYELAPATVNEWKARNGCTGAPQETYRKGMVHCTTTSGCNGGTSVEFCIVDGGGHTWPGSNGLEGGGVLSQDLDTSPHALDFLLKYSLP